MTLFDFAVILVVGVSALVALGRGLVREVLALATWLAALVLALLYATPVARAFGGLHVSSAVTEVIGFIAVFVGVLIVGGLVARLVSGAIAAIGLGWLDRLFGAAFGVVRGLALVLLGILIAGVTDLPRRPWWQGSAWAGPLTAAALEFREWLPPGWAARLDFSPGGRPGNSSDIRVQRSSGE